jgi:uroporphyrinogen-III decarboxylase
MRSVGFERFCIALYDDPKLIAGVLDWFVDFTIRNVRDLRDMGIDLIWIADDIAYNSGPMISPAIFAEVMMPRYREIAAEMRIPWVYHSDGDLGPILDALVSLGMSALHPVQPEAMDIFDVKRHYGDRVAVVGNVSIDTLTRGAPEDVSAAVRDLVQGLGLGGHLLSSGNCITGYLKPENVVEMGKAVARAAY